MRVLVSLRKGSWNKEHTASMSARTMFYYIQSAGYFLCNPDYMTEREGYNTMLLVYTVGGKGHLKYRGQKYSVEKGEGFIIDCNEYHYYASDKQDLWEFKWIHFNGCESRAYFERIYENSGPVFKLFPNSTILQNIDDIHGMIREGNKKIDIISSCRIVEILTEILLSSTNDENQELSKIPSPIKEVISKMERHFNQDINLDALAQEVGVSKYHLSRLFKKHTGYSPYEYLLNYRLSQAKNLLKSTDIPVCEISQLVGFNNPSHFINLFRKHEGITPLRFRKYWS